MKPVEPMTPVTQVAQVAHWPWQEAVAGLLVLLAIAYLGWRYAPAALRRAWRSHLARISRRLGQAALARRIEAVAQEGASCGSGCAACQSCGPREVGPSQAASGPPVVGRITPEALRRTIGGAPGGQPDAQSSGQATG